MSKRWPLNDLQTKLGYRWHIIENVSHISYYELANFDREQHVILSVYTMSRQDKLS